MNAPKKDFSIISGHDVPVPEGWGVETVKMEAVPASATWPLRHAVLRPHQTLVDCEYPMDHDARALHVGVLLSDTLVGVGSVFPEAQDGTPREGHFRLRGMAVAKHLQGRGLGSLVLAVRE